jgi:hypothetical protein
VRKSKASGKSLTPPLARLVLPNQSTPHFSQHNPTHPTLSMSKRKTDTMPGEPAKRQKREEYKKSLQNDAALPKKKFYRQRAHANPFSDHSLT